MNVNFLRTELLFLSVKTPDPGGHTFNVIHLLLQLNLQLRRGRKEKNKWETFSSVKAHFYSTFVPFQPVHPKHYEQLCFTLVWAFMQCFLWRAVSNAKRPASTNMATIEKIVYINDG